MGCTASSTENQVKTTPAQTPKPQPKKVDRAMLVVTDKKNETITRNKGDIGGNQFQADQLENCTIIIKDSVDSMTIDRCYDCQFAMSAIHGSIFVRDCQNCKFTVNCGQFRCRNCTNCEFFMHSRTGPVVEASSNIIIGCGTFSYDGVLDDLKSAQIDECSSLFYDVHDFTPGQGNFTVKDGQKIDISIPNETCQLPFLYLSISENESTYKVSLNKCDELCKHSFTDLHITKIQKTGHGYMVSIENSANAASILQSLS